MNPHAQEIRKEVREAATKRATKDTLQELLPEATWQLFGTEGGPAIVLRNHMLCGMASRTYWHPNWPLWGSSGPGVKHRSMSIESILVIRDGACVSMANRAPNAGLKVLE